MDSRGELGISPPQELVSPEELAKATKGVEEFKHTFAASSLGQRRLLRYGETAQYVQNTFLGLKPVSHVAPAQEALKRIPLPERFRFTGPYLFDQELVADKIAQNPDVFGDYPGPDDLDKYIDTLLSANPAASRDPDHVRKIGLLFGFPKDAALSYAKHMEFYGDTMRYFHAWAGTVLYSETGFSELEKEIILHIAHVDRKGHARLEPNYLEDFLDSHGEETRAFLKDYFGQIVKLTDDQVDYVVDNRHVNVRGIQYGTGSPTKATLDFPRKVKEIYAASGMNSVLRATKLLRTPK